MNIDNEYIYNPIVVDIANYIPENRTRIDVACENIPYVKKIAIEENIDVATAFLLAAGIDLRSIYQKYNVSKYAWTFYSTEIALYLYWRLYSMCCSIQYTSTGFIEKLSVELINEVPNAKTILPSLVTTLKNIKKRTFKNNIRHQFKIDYNSYGKDINYLRNKNDEQTSFSRALIPRHQYAYMKFHYLMSINKPKSSDIADFVDKLIIGFQTEISSLPNGKNYCTNESQWAKFRHSYRKIHDFAVNNKHNTSLPSDFNEIVQLLYYYIKKYSKSYTNEIIDDSVAAFYELESSYFFYSTTIEYSSTAKKYENVIIDSSEKKMLLYKNEMYPQLELFAITTLQCMPSDELINAFEKISSFTFITNNDISTDRWSMPQSISQDEWIQKRDNFIFSYRTDVIDKLKELLDINKLFQEQPKSYNIDLFLIRAIYHLNNSFFKEETEDRLRKIYQHIFSSTEITPEEIMLCRYIIFNEHVRCHLIKHSHTHPTFFSYNLSYFDVGRNLYPSPVMQRKYSIEETFEKCENIFFREILNLYFHHYSNAAIIPNLEEIKYSCTDLHILTHQKLNLIHYLEQALTDNKTLYEVIPNLI